ncbi:NUDIX hydrolase [Oleispira antarctica]|uniref:Phosphatase NudJ n=1 Tax=Oleispira antarctica TaxID=188908 RepID=A0A1Y5HQ21_OLEAN|nr:NUDIX hydrolase [Oleispira antarctica]
MPTQQKTPQQSERWTPHATVATIVEKDGRFLLVEEHRLINSKGDFGVVYNQPAGHVDKGESIMAAAIRETLEETRWQVKLKHLVGIYIFTAPANGVTYHRYCFAAEAVEHQPLSQLDDGILDAKWFSWDEIQQLNNLRSPLVKRCLQDHIKGKQYPLDLIYEHTAE